MNHCESYCVRQLWITTGTNDKSGKGPVLFISKCKITHKKCIHSPTCEMFVVDCDTDGTCNDSKQLGD